MSDTKIQVKIGTIEFSGEGNQDWLSDQLTKILDRAPQLLANTKSNKADDSSDKTGTADANGGGIAGLSVINIAGKLSCKSGADLVMAAGAYLHFIEDKKVFSREDIANTMKKATGFYKNTFLSNLTTTLARLEGNSSLTKSGSGYALSANKVTELYALLSK